jgi:tetratricopeptide (TPR) repeat protein
MLPANYAAASATPTTADPNATASFADKGEAAFKSGDYSGAAYAWKHAVVDTPENPVLGLMLSQALFATGKYDEAAGMAQAAMSQLPKDKWGVVVANSRELYGNYQDYTNQLRTLEAAARAKPNDPAMRFLLGYHYAYLGYPQQALDQLNKVLSIAPNDEGTKQLRDELQSKVPGGGLTPPQIVPPVAPNNNVVPPPAAQQFQPQGAPLNLPPPIAQQRGPTVKDPTLPPLTPQPGLPANTATETLKAPTSLEVPLPALNDN